MAIRKRKRPSRQPAFRGKPRQALTNNLDNRRRRRLRRSAAKRIEQSKLRQRQLRSDEQKDDRLRRLSDADEMPFAELPDEDESPEDDGFLTDDEAESEQAEQPIDEEATETAVERRAKARKRLYYSQALREKPSSLSSDAHPDDAGQSLAPDEAKADEAAHHLQERWQGEIYRETEAKKEAAAETFNVLRRREEARTESIAEEVKRHRLQFGDEASGMIRGAGRLGGRTAAMTIRAANRYALRQLSEAGEDNAGAEAAVVGIQSGERAARTMASSVRSQSLHPQPKKAMPEKGHIEKAAQVEHAKKERIKAFQRKRRHKAAVASSMRRRQETVVTAGGFVDSASTAFSIPAKAKKAAVSFIAEHKGMVIIAAVLVALFLLVAIVLTSLASLVQGGGTSIIETTYVSSDADIYAAENYYCALEDALDAQINQIQLTHPGYDDYEYQIDAIEHDPYQLISCLQARFGAFTDDEEIRKAMSALFSSQYELKVSESSEIRTRPELMTGSHLIIDPLTGEAHLEEYQYEMNVEYEHKTLYVSLTNVGFEKVARRNMTDEQLIIYDALNRTFGNRDYLFEKYRTTGGSAGVDYTIPPEALSDVKFANMIREAEKYLGRAYVWGGKSPRTGFDCSGFVCWVINNCGNGWQIDTMPARYLYKACVHISPSEARPGDLIFFEKTYDVNGASHVAIYVGEDMMIHAGDPIKYSSFNTRYFKEHFLGFGRLPFYDD